MAETLTAIACPKHGTGCVLSVVTAPKEEVEFPISPESWLLEFTQARPHYRIKELRHDPATLTGAGLLSGDLITVPKTAEGRINWLEKRAKRYEEAATEIEDKLTLVERGLASAQSHSFKVAELYARHREQYTAERGELLRDLGLALVTAGELQEQVERLEQFVTRKRRWKKKWQSA